MDEGTSELNGPTLPLSCLRLLVPPLQLVSAAIWQTVKQRVVADYGLLEEFVSLVTDIIPELLTPRQRAELIFGLRARLILELCRSEATANLLSVQPHLDRMQTLRSLWDVETENADLEISDSHFLGLVHILLRNPEERENFFRDVFPQEFGPSYDKAIHKLMWHFLSRLEKVLPAQTLQQTAALLNDASAVLKESMENTFHPQELKTLLEYQKDLHWLGDNDSYVNDTCILSALCLPPVERVVIVNEQIELDTEDSHVYTVCTEMEGESKQNDFDIGGTVNPEESLEDQQWLRLDDDVKVEDDTESVMELVEDAEPSFAKGHGVTMSATEEAEYIASIEAETVGEPGMIVIDENGSVTVLGGLVTRAKEDLEKTSGGCERAKDSCTEAAFDIQSEGQRQKQEMGCVVLLERLDMPLPLQSRPVRPNRGLKMKTYLSQRRKFVKARGRNGSSKVPSRQGSTKSHQTTHKIHGKMASRTTLLEQHMSQHSTHRPYTCLECKRQYKSLSYLQKHKCPSQSLKDLSRWKCSREVEGKNSSTVVKEEQASIGTPRVESEDLLSESSIQDPTQLLSADGGPAKESGHASSEHEKNTTKGPFYCPYCGIEFKCKQTFRYHLRNICYTEQQVDPQKAENVRQCFKCNECEKAFKFKSTLESHKHTHNPLYCEICMKLVRDSEALAMHKISHTPFQCNLCQDHFRVFKALYKHYIDVHKPSGPFICAHCASTFNTLKQFIRHEWKHTGHQPFQCPHCPKRFRSYSDLLEHQKKHTKEYPFLCWECGKKFRHSITLTRHVEREHNPDKPIPDKPPTSFPCTQCGKSFASKRGFLKHENFHHKGLQFPCEYCGKGFSGKGSLVRHTLIHTGERPFKCCDCGKSFRSASELKVHKRYHSGERPFKCSLCNKGFVQSCFLTLHMRTHTGERPYVCTTCDKGFSSLHGLKRHRKLVHS
ncbi:zinc finger protein 135-like isoform X2 [Lampris incognitus]|uniref:zinc finger protein 135-like isoform X2 n=1 Tax=Lampris incognitus TaxID=2546036 RepID=UPI0024B5D39A|nr:zinc finger protein 135-like isoform X2 [Lampris incognitus]